MNGREVQRARRDRLRVLSADRDLDGVLVYAWRRGTCCWFSGYNPGFATNYAALWQPAEGDPVMAVRFPFEAERAAESGVEIVPGGSPADLVPAGARRVGIAGGDMAIDETPGWLRDGLRARHVEPVDVRDQIDEWRAVKDDGDRADLVAAAGIAASAIAAAGTRAIVGETDFAIAAWIEAAGRAAGAFRISCLLGIGDGAVVTEAHGRIAGEGEPIGVELTLWASGACMHVNETILPIRPTPHQVRAVAICRAARSAMFATLAPGTPVDYVVAVGDAVLNRYGLLAAKEYDFGHGLGCDTPEHPRLVTGTRRSIETGNVLALHVAVRQPEGETAFIGGPVAIDRDGAHELLPGAVWTRPPDVSF